MSECPYCGAHAIDISVSSDDFDTRAAYLCNGPVCHRWREGEGPPPEEPEPLIILARA